VWVGEGFGDELWGAGCVAFYEFAEEGLEDPGFAVVDGGWAEAAEDGGDDGFEGFGFRDGGGDGGDGLADLGVVEVCEHGF